VPITRNYFNSAVGNNVLRSINAIIRTKESQSLIHEEYNTPKITFVAKNKTGNLTIASVTFAVADTVFTSDSVNMSSAGMQFALNPKHNTAVPTPIATDMTAALTALRADATLGSYIFGAGKDTAYIAMRMSFANAITGKAVTIDVPVAFDIYMPQITFIGRDTTQDNGNKLANQLRGDTVRQLTYRVKFNTPINPTTPALTTWRQIFINGLVLAGDTIGKLDTSSITAATPSY